MALGNLRGRARVSISNPQAMGECDRCGFWYPLSELRRQFQWEGAALADTGYLVCSRDQDVPQEQNRVLILPADPYPRSNPRPSYDTTAPAFLGAAVPTTPGNQGFTQYVLTGAEPGLYPTTVADMLAAVASLSGVATPSPRADRSVTLLANLTVPVMSANPSRKWLLLYNPVQSPAQLSLATALWGVTTNLAIGPGEAWFWATAQGGPAVTTSAITAIGLTAGAPLWAFEANV